MTKFISINNLPGNSGYAFDCSGKMFVTKFLGSTRIICIDSLGSYMSYDAFKADDSGLKVCSNHPTDPILYSGGELVEQDYYRQGWKFSCPTSLNALLLTNAKIIAVSNTEPLVLFYQYHLERLSLYIRDFDKGENYLISSFRTNLQESDIDTQISACWASFGAFSSKNNRDVFIKCGLFNYDNVIFESSNNYNKYNPYIGSNCINTDNLAVGDFNGDRKTDIICLNSKQLLINKGLSFIASETLPSYSGNWNQNFATKGFVHLGDFDGNKITEFLSFSTTLNPQILFGDATASFTSYSQSADGQFTPNEVSQWCLNSYNLANSDNIFIADVDNNAKDDIICRHEGRVYVMLSNSEPVPGIFSRVSVQINNAKIITLPREQYRLSRSTVSFCNATAIKAHLARVSCVFDSKNVIESIFLPLNPSGQIRNLELKASIQDTLDLSKRNFTIHDPRNELINRDRDRSEYKFLSQLVSKDFGVNIGNQRQFNSEYTLNYFRNELIRNVQTHNSKHHYNHIVKSGECNEVSYSYISIKTQYKAEARVQVFDKNNKAITDKGLLSRYINLTLSTNKTGFITLGHDSISFEYTGDIELKTPYRRTVKYCNKGNNTLQSLNNIKTTKPEVIPVFDGESCAFNSNTEIESLQGSSIQRKPYFRVIKRDDLFNMNAYIHLGYEFYSSDIADASEVYNNPKSYEPLYSSVLYNNGVRLVAFATSTNSCPGYQLRVQYWNSNNMLFEKASPYAAFDNIGKVHIEAFNTKEAILSWSTYLQSTNQYYIILEYVNTGADLLRLSSYDDNYSIITNSKYLINDVIIAYRNTNNLLLITKFTADVSGYKEIKTLSIELADYTETIFELVKHNEEKFSLIRSNKDNNGIFIQTYDSNLNKDNVQHNIICTPSQIVSSAQKNVLAVSWVEREGNTGKSSTNVQYLEDGFLTKRFELISDIASTTNIELESISFSNHQNNDNSFTIPDTTEVSFKSSNIRYVSSFNAKSQLVRNSFFYFDQSENKVLAFTEAATPSVIENPFVRIQNTIKDYITNRDQNKTNARTANEFNKLADNTLKEEKQSDKDIRDINSNAVKAFITTAEASIAEFSSGANPNTVAASNGLIIEEISSYPSSRTNSIADKVGETSTYSDMFDLVQAESSIGFTKESNSQAKNPQRLELGFNHDSVSLNANIGTKKALEGAVDFLYQGISGTISSLKQESVEVTSALENILCKNVFSKNNLVPVLSSITGNLRSNLVYEFKDNTLANNCNQDSSYQPMYRDKQTVVVCPTYNQVDINAECKNILQLAQYISLETSSLVFDKSFIYKVSPFVNIVTDTVLKAFSGDFLSTTDINQVCNNLNPYKTENFLQHNIARSLISGLLYQRPQQKLDAKLCRNLAINECSNSNDRVLNNLCFSDYLYIKSLLVTFTNTLGYNQDPLNNCATINCDIDSDATKALLSSVGGYFNSSTNIQELSRTELPKPSQRSEIIRINETFVLGENTTNTSDANITTTTAENIIDIDNFNYELYENIQGFISSSSVTFSDNTAFVTSAYQGNGFIELRGQFYNMTTRTQIGPDVQLGRFVDIRNFKVIAFDKSSIIVAASVRKQVNDNYNIIATYYNSHNTKLLNINPSINGIFDVKTISGSNTKNFVVSYVNDNEQLILRQYQINGQNEIVDVSTNEEVLAAQISSSYIQNVQSFITTFADQSYNLIWGAINSTKIFIKSSDIGSNTETIETTDSEVDILKTTTNKKGITAIGWQENNKVCSKLVQKEKSLDSFSTLCYSAWSGYTLQGINIMDSYIVTLSLRHINNSVQRLVFNGSSNTLANQTVLYEVAGNLIDPNIDTAFQKELERIDNITENTKDTSNSTEAENFISVLNNTASKIDGNVPAYASLGKFFGNKQEKKEIFTKLKSNIAKDKGNSLQELQNYANKYNLKKLLSGYNITEDHVYIVNAQFAEDSFYKTVDDVLNFSVGEVLGVDNITETLGPSNINITIT